MKITHLNKTFETIHYDTTLTSEDIQYIRDNFDNKFIYTAQKNIHYYDMSSGWGIRMLSAMSLNFNYYGTDPNTKLCQKLEELTKDFKKQTSYTGQVDIRNNGSEIFIPEWTQKINLAFSSIPYFDLEQYSTEGEQSIINYPQYNDWLELYWRKTVKNVTEYLVDDGYFILNIKDIPDYNLINDTKNIAIEEGFLYIGEYKDNSKALHDEEAVMIFVKEDKIKRINIYND